jgi:hypothetical protein
VALTASVVLNAKDRAVLSAPASKLLRLLATLKQSSSFDLVHVGHLEAEEIKKTGHTH